ncbi:GntR family transcriptional regulator [Paenibacillus methanolicus]|uniref:DNA-binding GntR family transcriptional regulator n=1 Tax=Paenibacillus methanolicus TaxID=582686 RepID=A0A5S5CHS0_9BACL|nr:GntR family transcriptional regulator [Paenibacillus methanolicus]TYP79336.1 DNA-binding GntR family transcriptional regulator [Paenibacillus methanolicus]
MFIYQKLRDSILKRQLAPGNQLVESVISDKLNVGRTPIRGAIRKLAEEGLVNVIPNRGAFVIQPTKEEIVQAYEIRMELEQLAARLAVPYMDETDYEHMQRLCDEEGETIQSSDFRAYLQVNKDFHMTYIRKCANMFLIEFAERMIDQTNIYLMLYEMVFFHTSPQTAPGAAEHRELIQIFRDRNEELAGMKVRSHIANAMKSLQIDNIQFSNLGDIF